MGHEGVADKYDVVLSPSDRGQKVGEIAVARDENDSGRRWSVLDERHDINCARYEDCHAVSFTVNAAYLSSSSPPSSFHCADNLEREMSEVWYGEVWRTDL